jgi:uncharacterized glyoxalase superfamily protein PhnB
VSETQHDGRTGVLPLVRYDDLPAAVEWLCRVFGFSEASRMVGADGRLAMADLRPPSGGAVLVGGLSGPIVGQMRATFGDDFQAPATSGWPHLQYALTVFIPDVDTHFAGVRAAGARIVSEPRDQPWGMRDYEVVDPEGRVWNFSQHLRPG